MILSLFITVGFDVSGLIAYVDGASVLITIGGSIGSILWALPINTLLTGLKSISITFNPPKLDPKGAIANIIQLSNLARRESLLALEEPVRNMEDPFLQKGIMLVVDGADPELVRNILDTEMSYIETRHNDVRGVWDYWGQAGPAWGMLGTLIGLINMLRTLDNPDVLGSQMAVAIVTTFYGSIILNVFCSPISNKLKIFSNDELLIKEILIEGILSIQAGDNPRIIEEKLKSFLSPALRKADEGSDGD
jgi:chemotaxis protein MotA